MNKINHTNKTIRQIDFQALKNYTSINSKSLAQV